MGAWQDQLLGLLPLTGTSAIDPVAYDTAWVARLANPQDPTRPAFPRCLAWLYAHQNDDGSWGSQANYRYDRVISTLAAVIAVKCWEHINPEAQARIARAMPAFESDLAILHRDPYATVGFELIFPVLFQEALDMGIHLPKMTHALDYAAVRQGKLKKLPPDLFYSPRTPTTFSLEALGDALDVTRAPRLQAEDGSLNFSPSATAYFLMHCPDSPSAWGYLARLTESSLDGGVPAVYPIDIFEPLWVLFNVVLAHPDRAKVMRVAEPHVAHLLSAWKPKGVGHNSVHYANGDTFAPDLDDTVMMIMMLRRLGVNVESDGLLNFEEPRWFRCYWLETDPSTSANIHLLDLVCHDNVLTGHRARIEAKLHEYLEQYMAKKFLFFDKWHCSPFYGTAHYVIAACEDMQDEMVLMNLEWIYGSQNDDGSWGISEHGGSAEETAYCLQAALVAYRAGRSINWPSVKRGVAYLLTSKEFASRTYRPLWIAKTIYTPRVVVHSVVLAALALYEELRPD